MHCSSTAKDNDMDAGRDERGCDEDFSRGNFHLESCPFLAIPYVLFLPPFRSVVYRYKSPSPTRMPGPLRVQSTIIDPSIHGVDSARLSSLLMLNITKNLYAAGACLSSHNEDRKYIIMIYYI